MSNLNQSEWPAGTVEWMTDSIFTIAFAVRDVTRCAMIPSPDPAAHVRHDNSTSQHSTKNKQGKSNATDIFLRNDQAEQFWSLAQRVPGLGGFGIYFDCHLAGEKRVLVHLDGRPERLLWVCPDQEKREYIYFHKDPVRFLRVLSEEFAKL